MLLGFSPSLPVSLRYIICMLSHFQLFAILWTVACPAPLSMGFSRQEYWSGLPCYPPGDLPHPGIKPEASCIFCLAGGFSTCEPLGKLRAKLQELFIPTFFFHSSESDWMQHSENTLAGSDLLEFIFSVHLLLLLFFICLGFLFVCLFCFLPHCATFYGIFVPQTGIEPLTAWSGST